MQEREYFSSLMVGRKATGKSTFTKRMADAYPRDKKVLIIDVNASPAYNAYKQIEPKDIKRVRSGIVRLIGTPTKETLIMIAADFRGGLVVFEDCTKYISGNVQPEIKTFLVDHRMYECDLIFTFHSLKMVPPFFWQMVSYVTLFKTNEIFEDARNRSRVPNYEGILKAYNQVKASKDNYINVTVETMV